MAIGLGVAGMTDPAKVLAFLDFTGAFDPSLMFVMVGAIGVYALAYHLLSKRTGPVLADRYHLPEATKIDARLLGGAALFGVGWGLAGLCPGPALTALATGSTSILIFVAAMVAGQVLFFFTFDRRR